VDHEGGRDVDARAVPGNIDAKKPGFVQGIERLEKYRALLGGRGRLRPCAKREK
jgi:hypothetical protein